jgi:hypothetical protein
MLVGVSRAKEGAMRFRRAHRLGLVPAVAVCALALIVAAATPARAQQIGSVVELAPAAFGTPPNRLPIELARGGPVVSNELIQTLDAAAVRIVFLGGSDLRLGAKSMIVLDRLVYDPDRGATEFVLGVAVGAARFVSGHVDPRGFAVRTPVALIGVRGTDFVVDVETSGRTIVAVIDGTVIVVPNDRPAVLVNAGQSAVVEPDPDIPVVPFNGLILPDDPGLGPIPQVRVREAREQVPRIQPTAAPEPTDSGFGDVLSPLLEGLIDSALTPTPEAPGAPAWPTEPPPAIDTGPGYTDIRRIEQQPPSGGLDRSGELTPTQPDVEMMVIPPRLQTVPLDAVTVPEYSPQDPDDIYR